MLYRVQRTQRQQRVGGQPVKRLTARVYSSFLPFHRRASIALIYVRTYTQYGAWGGENIYAKSRRHEIAKRPRGGKGEQKTWALPKRRLSCLPLKQARRTMLIEAAGSTLLPRREREREGERNVYTHARRNGQSNDPVCTAKVASGRSQSSVMTSELFGHPIPVQLV